MMTGKTTGYEPQILNKLPIPSEYRFPFMHGSPGSGLGESGFGEDAIKMGVKGEG